MPRSPLCFRGVIAYPSQPVLRGRSYHSTGQRGPLDKKDVISTEGGALAAAVEKSAVLPRPPTLLRPYAPEASLAITSISTSASFGSPATATVDRAGCTTPSGARYFA